MYASFLFRYGFFCVVKPGPKLRFYYKVIHWCLVRCWGIRCRRNFSGWLHGSYPSRPECLYRRPAGQTETECPRRENQPDIQTPRPWQTRIYRHWKRRRRNPYLPLERIQSPDKPRMPTMIILWRAWGIPYSSNLYKCGTTLYPPWVPAFFSSSMILVKAFPSLAFRRPPTFSATNHIGLYRFKTFTP